PYHAPPSFPTRRSSDLPGYRPTLADNLVHVNHFTPASLRLALERSGFTGVRVTAAAPEMPDGRPLDRVLRRAIFAAARLPGGVRSEEHTSELQSLRQLV